MKRRRFLAFCGIGVGATGGYIGWRWYQLPSLPDGMSVKTKHLERDVLTESTSREREFWDGQEEYQTTIPDSDAANRILIDADAITAFHSNTNFDDSYLIVVQNIMQSEMELVLDAISRRENGLHLDVSIDSPWSGPDDARIHSLLIRVTDEAAGIPENISVDITGYV